VSLSFGFLAFGFLSSFRLAYFVDNLKYHIPNWELMLRQPCLPPVSLQPDRLAFTVDETSCLSPWPPTNGPAFRVAGPTDSSCRGPLGSQSLSSKEEHLKETEDSSMNGESYEKGRAS